jgi:AraC-like DNA-binding protein
MDDACVIATIIKKHVPMRLSHSDLQIIQQVKDLLEKEYNCQHTQAYLANHFQISENKLRKGFTLVNKIAIYEYQVSIRIEKAKILLINTNEPLQQIALQVGYDLKSLEKQFKKKTGVSPLRYRKTGRMAQVADINEFAFEKRL